MLFSALAVGAAMLIAALAAGTGQVDAPTYTNTVGPAFIASIATLVLAIAALVRAAAAFKSAGREITAARKAAEAAAEAAADAAGKVDGGLAAKDAEVAQLRSELDRQHTQAAQQRRTIEVLLERERTK